ncbi:MAG: hypothetical protein ACI9T7_003865, partial [Oleiphilaceae bacterium]
MKVFSPARAVSRDKGASVEKLETLNELGLLLFCYGFLGLRGL